MNQFTLHWGTSRISIRDSFAKRLIVSLDVLYFDSNNVRLVDEPQFGVDRRFGRSVICEMVSCLKYAHIAGRGSDISFVSEGVGAVHAT